MRKRDVVNVMTIIHIMLVSSVMIFGYIDSLNDLPPVVKQQQERPLNT